MNKEMKIQVLSEYREANELKKAAEKRVKELKEKIMKDIEEGKYGHLVLEFETRDVKSYVVPARTDTLIKIAEIK